MARVISGLILFFCMAVASAVGEKPLKSALSIDGAKVAFLTFKFDSLSISSSCKKGEVLDCAAYAAFKRRETAQKNLESSWKFPLLPKYWKRSKY